MKKFLNVLLVTFLVVVIVGGVGYIGYSYLFMDHSGMNMTDTQDSQNGGIDSSTQSQSGMQHGSGSQSKQSGNSSQPSTENLIALNQTTVIFKNKETLSTAMKGIDESLGHMTLDPYGINETNVIRPDSAGQSGQTDSPAMKDMGTVYDSSKMEQLHKGLYNLSVGKALLEQLDSDLTSQAEFANAKVTDPVSYYTTQYNLTQQNKIKLNSALGYINSGVELANINPYISAQGLVYDKDRMNQIHQSVFKLAEGVAALNLLNDDLTKQSMNLVGMTQSYILNASTNAQTNHSGMSTGLFGGIFDNISIQSLVNIILILFVAGLIFGIFGFILSLLKGPAKGAKYVADDQG